MISSFLARALTLTMILDMIYQKFKDNLLSEQMIGKKICIAVSGGLDSMTLLHMLTKFACEFNIDLHIVTINHNLREHGARDAEFVLNYSIEHNMSCEILEWKHGAVYSNIQSKAREARYRLLTDYCKKHEIETLLTAHHGDDQIENFFIKLSRGASVYSLGSNKIAMQNGIRVFRPMADILRQEIEIYAQENNIPFVEDETNSDTKYLRNEIRKKLSVFFADSQHMSERLFKNRILCSIGNITRATRSLEHLVSNCISMSFDLQGNQAILTLRDYEVFMQEEQMQALSKVLQMVASDHSQDDIRPLRKLNYGKEFLGNEERRERSVQMVHELSSAGVDDEITSRIEFPKRSIRMHSITRLYHAIMSKVHFSLTLHGCIIRGFGDIVKITQETSRIS